MSQIPCPCGSGLAYAACCRPYLDGEVLPPTAEALMRSRYVAYARQAIDYLEATSSGQAAKDFRRRDVERWARSARFIALKITERQAGGVDDAEGLVAFTATFEERGQVHQLQERSRFARVDGAWRYVGSEGPRPAQRTQPKVGRNAPCPCGSGKKHKRCCGR